jgi:hypothetical protein
MDGIEHGLPVKTKETMAEKGPSLLPYTLAFCAPCHRGKFHD